MTTATVTKASRADGDTAQQPADRVLGVMANEENALLAHRATSPWEREPYAVPSASVFGSDEFVEADDLRKIADRLIDRHTEFDALRSLRLLFRWRKTGGQSGGQLTLGKCVKASGLTRHFADADFIVWLAADHARDLKLQKWQVEALVYHELSHAGYDEETGKLTSYGHEFEGFRRELDVYGPWSAGLKLAAGALAVQSPLFDREPEDDEDGDA